MDLKKATTLASVTVMTFMLAGGYFVKVDFYIQLPIQRQDPSGTFLIDFKIINRVVFFGQHSTLFLHTFLHVQTCCKLLLTVRYLPLIKIICCFR